MLKTRLRKVPFPLKITERSGGLYVKSAEIPGFYLFNRDPDKLLEDIPEVAKIMLADVFGDDVQVFFQYEGAKKPRDEKESRKFLMSQPPIWVYS
jgi:hypothetical protein